MAQHPTARQRTPESLLAYVMGWFEHVIFTVVRIILTRV